MTAGRRLPVSLALAVPTYRRERVLVDTLEQVLAQDPPPDEVLVVDQSERHDPETEAFLAGASAAGRLRWIRHAPPGLPGARNRALAESTCEVVLFIDDDVELEPGFVARHAANYADPAVAAVGGRVVQARAPWQIAARRRPWPRRLDCLYLRPDGTERLEGVATFQGGNHSIRRAVALAAGGYDEGYLGWAFREESDLALRLWEAGHRIVFDPLAALTHLQAEAGGCRYEEHARPVADWTIAYPGAYFAWRHLFPAPAFWREIAVSNLARSVLRKQNARRPWRLPFALASYAWAVGLAGLAAARAPRRRAPEQGRVP